MTYAASKAGDARSRPLRRDDTYHTLFALIKLARMMRCLQYCADVADFVRRQSFGCPTFVREMVFLFYEGPKCVPEACGGNRDCDDFEREVDLEFAG